jgi:hypothetical protein
MSEFIIAAPENYPHWGECVSCGKTRDLNRDLYCVVCQTALNESRALMVLDRIYFQQSIPVPKK